MILLIFLLQLQIELTPEQVAAARQLISNAREAASDNQTTPASPPRFAPIGGGDSPRGVPPIGDKSFAAGGSNSGSSEGVSHAPPMRNQKRCLCGPECPYCTGDCSTCDCIYQPLPKPGPGKIQWVRIRIQALRLRF